MKKKLSERFWDKVAIGETRLTEPDCWIWGGALNDSGGGIMFVHLNGKRKKLSATRVSAQLAGLLTPNLLEDTRQVRHKCNRRHCVNPDHLYVV